MNISWLDGLFFALAVLFAVVGFVGIIMLCFVVVMWWRERDAGEDRKMIWSVKADVDNIKKDVNEIKEDLSSKG